MEEMKAFLKKYKSILVAYSGGVDSSLLLDLAVESLGRDRVLGVFMNMAFQTEEDVRIVLDQAKERNWPLEVFNIANDQVSDQVLINPKNRCYYCKKMIFEHFIERAKSGDFEVVCDGTNLDDLGDYRPGRQALEELGIVSPFLDCGWTKERIRQVAKERGIPTWNRSSDACLASRIPYEKKIDLASLKRVEEAENYLKGLGFTHVRVRTRDSFGRIEVAQDQVKALLGQVDQVEEKLKDYGYEKIEVDPRGYRQGSLNKEEK